MATIHRTLAGQWAVCRTPERCGLKFHFPDTTPEEMAQLPMPALLRLLNVIDPPSQAVNDTMSWRDKQGQIHRDYDLPAIVEANGSMHWYRHGLQDREGDLPSAIVTLGDTRMWHRQGKVHRVGAPAITDRFGREEWWRYGQRHRDGDLPAVIEPNGSQEWWVNDQRHREHGPAIISKMFSKRSESWWYHDQLHRTDGPAVVEADGAQEWYVEGMRHREDGPAIIMADGKRYWFVNDEEVKPPEGA